MISNEDFLIEPRRCFNAEDVRNRYFLRSNVGSSTQPLPTKEYGKKERLN